MYEGLRKEDREVQVDSKPYLNLWQVNCKIKTTIKQSDFTIKIVRFI